MKQITVFKANGEKAGEITLPEKYFEAQTSEGAVYYAVNAVMTNRRQGNAATKGRSQVNASTRKPWRQKGTGRARAGMRSSPIWRGGGTLFGPQPKDYDVRVPKKVRQIALRSALTAKAAEQDSIGVVESLDFTEPKTRQMVEILENVNAGSRRVLVLTEGYKPLVWKSARNIPFVQVKPFAECNAHDVMLAEKLIIEKNVIEQLEQKSNEGSIPDSEAAPADREE
ncbi:MAG TPA: 50S ribosomal protein L4 [archaeon]|nr:50S ribosomal protein L4 [archaeon]